MGVAAGLSTADDTGRRYLIGVAAAAQSGVFAVWIGVAAVVGVSDTPTTLLRRAAPPPDVVAIAAGQPGVFAVWIGVAAVLGFPDTPTTLVRIATLTLNVVAIAAAACASYG